MLIIVRKTERPNGHNLPIDSPCDIPLLPASSCRPAKSVGPHHDVRRPGDVEVFRASRVTCENAANKYDDAVHFPVRWRGALT